VVVCPDGETVVIGGLMENGRTSIDTKVPILGDIPLLGALFKRTQKDHTKKELIIFLTPHVVLTPAILAQRSVNESHDWDMAPKSFSEQELNQYLGKFPLKPEPTTVKP